MVSATIQNNRVGHDKFITFNGYDVFLNILKSASIPLRLRICFVIDCLCSQFPQIKCKCVVQKSVILLICNRTFNSSLEKWVMYIKYCFETTFCISCAFLNYNDVDAMKKN